MCLSKSKREALHMREAASTGIRYTVRPIEGAGTPITFEFDLSEMRVASTVDEPDALPDWTRLAFEQCACCPLSTADNTRCPAAAAIAHLMRDFGSVLSYDKVGVSIESNDRVIYASVPAQKVLSSILGLVMGTSGCPILAKFMPMARFHLPFATTDETTFRSVGAYLIAQYFAHREGGRADWNLEGLKDFYEDVHTINRAMVARLRGQTEGDAGANAVAILDLFAHYLPMAVDQELAELRPLFAAFEDLDKSGPSRM